MKPLLSWMLGVELSMRLLTKSRSPSLWDCPLRLFRLVVCISAAFTLNVCWRYLGRACGASYINERYEKLLLKRLKHEKYLVKNGKTIKSIVEGKVVEFENGEKRLIDTVNESFETDSIYIDDLRANSTKRFTQNRLWISKWDPRNVHNMTLRYIQARNDVDFSRVSG